MAGSVCHGCAAEAAGPDLGVEGQCLPLARQAVWNAHVRGRFDHHRLATLAADPQLFEQLTTDMRERGVGPAAQRRVLMVLSAVLSACVRWKKIAVNPVGQVPKPLATRQRNPRPFPPAVVELICDEIRCRPTKDRDAHRPVGDALLVSLMSYAGLRPGEALALRFSDIGERTISVDKAVADGQEGPTKTGQARTVPLVGPLRVDVAMWRQLRNEANDNALLFPSAAGSHRTRTEFGNWRNRVWKPAVQAIAARDPKLGWLGSARPYDCRGSFVSLQLRAGATPMEVAAWGGHSPQVMYRHYAGVIEELVGEPRLSAEAQIEAARAALRQRTDAELADLAGSLVEQPTAAGTEAYRLFYPIEVEDIPGALDELPEIETVQSEMADRLAEWIERRAEREAWEGWSAGARRPDNGREQSSAAARPNEVLHAVTVTTHTPPEQGLLITCSQCGARTQDIDGPTHPYMVSSPGCWQAFAELQADELARFGYPPAHGLAVDAYASSHGGEGSERRDRQSVCLHLMAICLVLETEGGAEARMMLLREMTATKRDWPALQRPPGVPRLNHQHAAAAADVEDYTSRVRDWARAVWEFWTPEHPRVRALLDRARPGCGTSPSS